MCLHRLLTVSLNRADTFCLAKSIYVNISTVFNKFKRTLNGHCVQCLFQKYITKRAKTYLKKIGVRLVVHGGSRVEWW